MNQRKMQKIHSESNNLKVFLYLTFRRIAQGYDRFHESSEYKLEILVHVYPLKTNQKFLMSLPSPGPIGIKGSTGSSSSVQNVAFVSFESTSSTNDVSTAYGVSTSSGYNSQRENRLSSIALMNSCTHPFSNKSSGLHLDHEESRASLMEVLLQEDREKAAFMMPRNQLDLTRPNSNAIIDTRKGILVESADQKGTLNINQNTMEGDMENKKKLKLWRQLGDARYRNSSLYSSFKKGRGSIRKEFAQDTEDLLLQAGAVRATSTNTVNTASTLVSTDSPLNALNPKFPKKVYKVVKALYGLHQAPRAWSLIKSRFQMSSMGELTFFLGLQVKQKEDGIFISQDKYVAEILKKFDFASVKTASTPIKTQKPLTKDEEAADVDVTLKTSHLNAVKRIFRYLKGKPKLGLWYPRVSSFDLEAYSDSDYAGENLDRKSTTGDC
ncbi:putative ribonuclease H-like domain-containing protein [Tanacetum coccineum]